MAGNTDEQGKKITEGTTILEGLKIMLKNIILR
jgi:hypothetical protein